MKFEPVWLPEGRALDEKASQTLIRHFSRCPRSGHLYRVHGSAPTAEMARGSVLHEIQRRVTLLAVEMGEVMVPAEVAKAEAEAVLEAMHVPVEEHDAIREMTWRWASEFTLDPSAVIAVETLFALDVPVRCLSCEGQGTLRPLPGGRERAECPTCDGSGTRSWEVRCRIDFAETAEGGAAVRVEDVKSSKAAVPWEEMSRKRTDGSLHARDLQLILYALALAYGVPVREEPCGECRGAGYYQKAYSGEMTACGVCNGKGTEEIREPFPVASRAQRFDLAYVYPAIENQEGKMVRRDATLTRLELETYRQSLQGVVGRLAAAEQTGLWPALVSDHACSECPASALCPIPAELRDHRGTINTVAECAEALEVRFREKKTQAARAKEIRAFVKARGPIRFGGGMVAEIGFQKSQRIADKEAFMDAVERAVRYGEPLDRAEYVKTVESFPLVERALTADELAELASEGVPDDGRDAADDVERRGGAQGGQDAGAPVVGADFEPGGASAR